eukprot:CAMPEP_0177612842 /NCGR_PEP_ID=MMETSP0419_2-20121207/21539_1 /TAXON_ID=582737 /ORGANISM="Tetraselmis sp., Strain GSL018" /LENGTH=61 /DNA_ID=CAMNT_0019109263 /DNA_START=235 /DNA_END=416 /DNA_ORIENTATION=-
MGMGVPAFSTPHSPWPRDTTQEMSSSSARSVMHSSLGMEAEGARARAGLAGGMERGWRPRR